MRKQHFNFLFLITTLLTLLLTISATTTTSTPPLAQPVTRYPPQPQQTNQTTPIIPNTNITILINNDTSVIIQDTFLLHNNPQTPLTTLTLYVNGIITSLSFKANISLNVKLIQSTKTSQLNLTIQQETWTYGEVQLTYELQDFTIKLQDSFLFSYTLPYATQTISFVDIALPPNSQIETRIIAGKLTPLISPLPTYNYSDGIRTHLRWEPANFLITQPLVIEYQIIIPTTPEDTTTITTILIFLAGLITGILGSILIFFIQQKIKQPPAPLPNKNNQAQRSSSPQQLSLPPTQHTDIQFINLTDQERKIIYALMDLHKKASQEALRNHLKWGKSKLSTYLKRLEAKNIITQIEVGRKKYVHLIGDVEL